jgi:hypothetical protein
MEAILTEVCDRRSLSAVPTRVWLEESLDFQLLGRTLIAQKIFFFWPSCRSLSFVPLFLKSP